ncbi:hypothetical protein [Mobilicoccus massiliensis]|uniref:hypothetical protein n=1 Tax=Mobilicoccus massiliensis TaxID=1522310 RepID=UPI0011428C8D|nr:hypothetical protein [Mobilicoccus massiliensis]
MHRPPAPADQRLTPPTRASGHPCTPYVSPARHPHTEHVTYDVHGVRKACTDTPAFALDEQPGWYVRGSLRPWWRPPASPARL